VASTRRELRPHSLFIPLALHRSHRLVWCISPKSKGNIILTLAIFTDETMDERCNGAEQVAVKIEEEEEEVGFGASPPSARR
jgi:uncharacterized protein (DUF934 family)